jgi:hypothetical protein
MFDFARVIGPPIKPEGPAGEKEPTASRSTHDIMGVEISGGTASTPNAPSWPSFLPPFLPGT